MERSQIEEIAYNAEIHAESKNNFVYIKRQLIWSVNYWKTMDHPKKTEFLLEAENELGEFVKRNPPLFRFILKYNDRHVEEPARIFLTQKAAEDALKLARPCVWFSYGRIEEFVGNCEWIPID